MSRVRIPVTPTLAELRALNIFVSYKSSDWNRAQLVRNELQNTGLRITMLPAHGLPAATTTSEIEITLSKAIEQADGLCLIASPQSVRSDWVKFEFEMAADL